MQPFATPQGEHFTEESDGPSEGARLAPHNICEDELARLQSIADDADFEMRVADAMQRYPDCERLWKVQVHRSVVRKDFERAVELIEARRPDAGETDDFLHYKADLLHDAREVERAAAMFAEVIARNPERLEFRITYAKRLFNDGELVQCNELLAPIREKIVEGSNGRAFAEKVHRLYQLLCDLEGRAIREDENARILAMKHAILSFRDRRPRRPRERGLGQLALITGSLGPGGAERQLTRLAVELETQRRAGNAVGGIKLDRPVEIIVRSCGPEKQNDFYLADVKAAGVEIHQINPVKPLATRDLQIEDETLAALIDFLPPHVNFGVRRLTPRLRESATDTASIWQDGACLFAGLASLIADVPHIQLAIRGLPPSMRRHMYRPEYEVLYRALAEVPGVTFLSNSRSAARAYAEWLDLPLERFTIVYNGVERMRPVPSDQCEARWQAFLDSTGDATQTVGGVFRLDTDKQPLLWIRFAAAYLKRHPDTRFIVVGGGRLLPNAEQLAEELGLRDRIMFVGRSMHVGYWMSKMDALVLLSRYEGLPNVLIEAQYMGVRVVTTPAGGASECLIDGVTGHVLECAEKPDLDGIVDRVRNLVERSDDRDLFAEGGEARHFLDTHFSIPRMLEDFVTCVAMRGVCDLHGTPRLRAA